MDERNQAIAARLAEYRDFLRSEERSRHTIDKYGRDLKAFFTFLGDRRLTKEAVIEWKEELCGKYAPASTNSMLAALNSFLEWIDCGQYRVKALKVQKAIFAKQEKELTREEYQRLVRAAESGNHHRLAMILRTVCSTGIRVSELHFITVEALSTGRANVECKGKMRTVFLPGELCRTLHRYCREQKLHKGMIFRSRNGRPLDRSNIWRDMKKLCADAGVEPSKVFPHNLRHLFARTYYALEKDLSKLADLLGHSSVNTTRIYTMESGREHVKQLDRMRLVCA